MLLDNFNRATIATYTLLTFTLTLTFFELKCSNLKRFVLPLLLLEIIQLQTYLHPYTPFQSYLDSVMISNYDSNGYTPKLLNLIRSSFLAVANVYVYFKLFFNFVLKP